MKKYVLFGFAAAMTLASCTQSEVLETAIESPMEFSSFVNKTTKAPVDDLNFEGSTFGVWGYKGKGTETPTTPIFDSQGTTGGKIGIAGNEKDNAETVKYTSKGWSYDNLRFWDKTCNYAFLAYAPVDNSVTATINAEKDIIITDFTINSKIANQIDLVIADPINLAKGILGNNNGKIQFNFRHILTKANIQFLKSTNLSSEEVKLVSAELKGIGSKATYAKKAWGETTIPVSFQSIVEPTDLSDTTPTNMFKDMLMIPQSFEAGKFNLDITYTINGEQFTRTIDLGTTPWTKNMNILYTLKIDASSIIFENPTITDGWDTVSDASNTVDQ